MESKTKQRKKRRPRLSTIAKVWMTSGEAAEYIGVAKATLSSWRHQGTGPVYVQPSRVRVFYHVDDIDDWMAQHVVKSRKSKELHRDRKRRKEEPIPTDDDLTGEE